MICVGACSPMKKISKSKFGDICHASGFALIILPPLWLFPAYSSAISHCMTFLHRADANVHIAAIVFFDMLTTADEYPHNISYDKNRVG
ncbi:hypothetical protein CRX67_01690 [Enterobacteriaceae bacterium A-F18]|nr:hypothetical protein CRX67_01690 [Enterobacteriaceae bacterium A-F18]